MRLKLSFQKNNDQFSSVPLHHQHLIAKWMDELSKGYQGNGAQVNFSSFKGTSKVQNGMIRFLSSKITLVISSSDDSLLKMISEKIMNSSVIDISKLQIIPKRSDLMPDPEFTNRMKYVCISPMVASTGNGSVSGKDPFNPSTGGFADILFQQLMDSMEGSGFTPEQLDEFQVFGLAPDRDYMSKMTAAGKKVVRTYQDKFENEFFGYLFPFTLHAHPAVHKFIWERGLGALTSEGYGMIDLADKPVLQSA